MNNLVQILNCSEALGTCCTDYGLLTILDVLRQVLDLIQLIVPILLMVALAVQFTQLLVNPDDDKKKKSLLNKFIAALLCFFVPFLVNLAIGLVPDDIGSFQLGACWDTARISREVLRRENSVYVSTTDKPPQVLLYCLVNIMMLPLLKMGEVMALVLVREQGVLQDVQQLNMLSRLLVGSIAGVEKILIIVPIVVVLYLMFLVTLVLT